MKVLKWAEAGYNIKAQYVFYIPTEIMSTLVLAVTKAKKFPWKKDQQFMTEEDYKLKMTGLVSCWKYNTVYRICSEHFVHGKTADLCTTCTLG